MQIRASSFVLRTNRTFNAVEPSLRTVCQSLPPSSTSPDRRSTANEPTGTTATRRWAPGVAPTISKGQTSKCMTNSGLVRTVFRTSGKLSFREVDMTVTSIAPNYCGPPTPNLDKFTDGKGAEGYPVEIEAILVLRGWRSSPTEAVFLQDRDNVGPARTVFEGPL